MQITEDSSHCFDRLLKLPGNSHFQEIPQVSLLAIYKNFAASYQVAYPKQPSLQSILRLWQASSFYFFRKILYLSYKKSLSVSSAHYYLLIHLNNSILRGENSYVIAQLLLRLASLIQIKWCLRFDVLPSLYLYLSVSIHFENSERNISANIQSYKRWVISCVYSLWNAYLMTLSLLCTFRFLFYPQLAASFRPYAFYVYFHVQDIKYKSVVLRHKVY